MNEKLNEEIRKTLKKSPLKEESVHAELVLKWILVIKPDADESLKIAALSHDIERAFTGITEKDLKDYSEANEFKREHAIRSAGFISEILEKYDYPNNIIEKVKTLVLNHEVGGDKESDILKDADSLAYFEYNIPFYLARSGEEKTKDKIKFMYKRMSDDAKKLAKSIDFQDEMIYKLFQEAIAEI